MKHLLHLPLSLFSQTIQSVTESLHYSLTFDVVLVAEQLSMQEKHSISLTNPPRGKLTHIPHNNNLQVNYSNSNMSLLKQVTNSGIRDGMFCREVKKLRSLTII